jgi:O-antigen ligase
MVTVTPRPRVRGYQHLLRFNLYSALLIALGAGIAIMGSMAIGATPYGFLVFGGVMALVAGLAIMLRPELGLYLLVIFVFTNLSDVLEVAFGIPSTNKPLVALIFVGTLASRIVLHHKPLVFRGTEMIILAYGLVTLVSLLGAPNESDTQSIMIDWAKDYAILFIIVQLAGDEIVWKRMQWALIGAAAFLGLLSCYQVLTGNFENTFYGLAGAPVHEVVQGFDSNRITGPLEDPNYYGMVMLMTLPLATYRLLTERHPLLRTVAGIAFLLILATVVFTYSRGAFVCMLIVGLLIIRERKLNFYKIGGGVAILALALIPVLPKGFTDRLSTLTDLLPTGGLTMQTESSFRGRSSEAIVALRMFRDYPLIGVGHGNYATSYLEYSSQLGLDDRLEDRQAHSLYLELAAETGVIGIAVFGTMLVVLFMGMWRAKQLLVSIGRHDLVPWVMGIRYGLIAYLLASLFLHADYIRYFWLTVAFAASSSVVAESLYRRATEDKFIH